MTESNHYENQAPGEQELTVLEILKDASQAIKIRLVPFIESKLFKPSFFQPLTDFSDVARTLLAPIYAPFLLACATVLTTLAVTLMAAACIAAFITTGVLALFRSEALAMVASTIGYATFIMAAVGALAVLPALIIGTVLSFPIALINIITRTGSSAVTGISHLVSKKETTSPILPDEKFAEEILDTPYRNSMSFA